jgi:hypothetical protein
VSSLGRNDSADISAYVAQAAERMHDRLAEVPSSIRRSLEDDIPELRGNARIIELHGASVEGNVDTLLRALRYDIAVQHLKRRLQRLSSHDGWHNTTFP